MKKKSKFGGKLIQMQPSSDLFRLIKSLSPSEKRHFTIDARKHSIGKKNIYLKLYEDLEYFSTLYEDYDEKIFVKKFKSKPYIKNITVNKNYLFEQLLTSMRGYQSIEYSAEQIIFNLIKDIKFFKKKRLLILWLKTIEKAKELAINHEKYYLLLQIQKLEYNYHLENNQQTILKKADEYRASFEATINNITSFEELDRIDNYFYELILEYGQNQLPQKKISELNKKMMLPIIANHQIGNSISMDRKYYQIQKSYYFLLKDFVKCAHFLEKTYRLSSIHNNIFSTLDKIIVASNYLTSLFHIADFETFNIVLNEIKKISTQNEDEKGELFQTIIFNEQLQYLNKAKIDESIAMEKEINKGLALYKDKISISRKVSLLNNLAISFFIAEKWEKCLIYSRAILDTKSQVRLDIKYNSKIIELICLLEINDIIQLSNCLRNLSRAKEFEGITSNKNYFIVELLQQIVKKTETKNEILSAFYNSKKFVADNSEFHFWLKSKIEKRKMKLVFEEIINKKTLSN